jgi:hypothetical protein
VASFLQNRPNERNLKETISRKESGPTKMSSSVSADLAAFAKSNREGLERIKEALLLNPAATSVRTPFRQLIDFWMQVLATQKIRGEADSHGMRDVVLGHDPFLEWLNPIRRGHLDQWIRRVEVKAVTANDVTLLKELDDFFAFTLDALRDHARSGAVEADRERDFAFELSKLEHGHNLVRNTLSLSEREREVDAAVQNARAGRDTVNQIVQHVSEAAGEVAASEMAQYFGHHADSERIRYRLWVASLSASIGCSIALAWFLVDLEPNASFTAHEFGRLVLIAPILAFSGYCARQVQFHRDNESSARLTAVRLQTVKAFVDAVDDKTRNEILRSLGLQIFSEKGPSQHSSQQPVY